MSNTSKHISDQASTVIFNPEGTQWGDTIIDVQTALGKLGSYCSIDNGLPEASVDQSGIIQIATTDEARLGEDGIKAITPKTLNDVLTKPEATDTTLGSTQYAKDDEANDETINNRSITPKTLDYVFKTRKATEAKSGALKVATKAQSETGADDDVLMTPLKVKYAINALVQSTADATESRKGVSKMATTAEIQAGVAREGVAISPYGFANARATGDYYGTFKAAQPSDMATLSAEDKAVTPKVLGLTKASGNQFGLVKLSQEVNSSVNTALAANAKVLPTTGGTMTGALTFNESTGLQWTSNNKRITGENNVIRFYNDAGFYRFMHGGTESVQINPEGIYEHGHRVYSPRNNPTPETIGAIRNSWGGPQITGYINDWDDPMNWYLGVGYVMVGLNSHHANSKEDRLWRVWYRKLG